MCGERLVGRRLLLSGTDSSSSWINLRGQHQPFIPKGNREKKRKESQEVDSNTALSHMREEGRLTVPTNNRQRVRPRLLASRTVPQSPAIDKVVYPTQLTGSLIVLRSDAILERVRNWITVGH